MKLKHLWEVWGKWEIRVLVLSSLSLQIFLLFTGGLRKRKADWWLRMPLWLAYLLADYIAIYALGNLSQNQKLCDGSLDGEMHLLVFWAPFLILHLGGQDTITAFAVEDNELWLRHFLSLLSQVALAGYVYWKSRPGIRLMIPAIVMFLAGVTKYGERTLALRAASMGALRSSMLTPPDPGPNYAKFVEECQSRREAGLDARIVIVPERPPGDDVHVEVRREDYGDLVYSAHRLFHTFRRLFVDLILSFQDRIDSIAFFRKLEMDQAFKVVEIELVLMYESLHSKAPVIHGWLGRGLRMFTMAAPVMSLVLFTRAVGDTPGYASIDIDISYTLLVGAIFLEIYAILLIIISPWTYADLRASEKLRPAAGVVFWLIKIFHPEKRPRWSNKMSQYNLISYSLKDKSNQSKRFMEWLEWKWNFRIKTMWDSWRYTKTIDVSEPLKDLIFVQLKSKANSTKDPNSYRKLGEHRGQWALQRKGLYQRLSWSVDCEFDESILLWHIATDLCFYAEHPAEKDDEKCCGCSCFYQCLPCFGRSGSGRSAADNAGVGDRDPLATLSRDEQGDIELHAVRAGDAAVHDDGEHRANPVRRHLRGDEEFLPARRRDRRRGGLRGQAHGRGHVDRGAAGREGGQEQVGAVPGVQAREAAEGAGGGEEVAAHRERVGGDAVLRRRQVQRQLARAAAEPGRRAAHRGVVAHGALRRRRPIQGRVWARQGQVHR